MLKRYTDTVIEAMGTGLFTYFAHPDLFMRFCEKYEPFMEPYFRKICECAKKYDIPLEINLGRLRDIKCSHRPGGVYPCEEFFKIVSEYQNKVIIGVDAHSPNDFDSSMTDFEYAEELIRKYNLPAINRIKF